MQRSCGVIGGGFGLYGWLCAFDGFPDIELVTLERYRSTLERRDDLRRLREKVRFVPNETDLVEECEVIAFARRPVDQEEFVRRLLRDRWRGTLFLEKPIARRPVEAIRLVRQLEDSDVDVAAGFTLAETPWAGELRSAIDELRRWNLTIRWNFLAHHFENDIETWKRHGEEGGGALRFYAIHLIALIAEWEKWTVVRSDSRGDESVSVELTGESDAITLECDSHFRGPPAFEIELEDSQRNVLLQKSLRDPFAETRTVPGIDFRVPLLEKIATRAFDGKERGAVALMPHLELWNEIEAGLLRDS